MAKKEVTVVINGEETVSPAAEAADGALSGFAGKIPGWGKALAVLAVAYQAISSAVGAAKDFVLDSIQAYDKFAASQRKLEGTAKLSGIAISALQGLADEGRKAFGLAAETSNDFASEIGKLTQKSGDITKSKDAMAAFLDIGAARGLSAADTLKAVQQAVLGIDEGTDKLFGKNPSVLYEEYADKVGKSAGKLTDQEKAQALLDATLTGGEATRGAYLEYLQSAAGQQEQVNQKVEESQVKFGEALQPVRTLVLQGLNKLLDVLGPVVIWLGQAANAAGVTVAKAFQGMKIAVGDVVGAFGRLTGNKDLEAWGRSLSENGRQAIEDIDAMVAKLASSTKNKADEAEVVVKKTSTTTKDELSKQEKEYDEHVKKVKAWWKLLDDSVVSYKEIIKTLGPEVQKAMQKQHVEAQTAALDAARVNADALIKKMKESGDLPQYVKPATDAVGKLGDELSTSVDFVIDVADEFGGLDGQAKNVLTSVKNIGTSIGDLAKSGLSFAGVAGLLGGVASIVATMMGGDADRRRLMRENNQRLAEVRDGLDEFRLEISGGDQQTLVDILTEGLADGPFTGSSQLPALMNWLKQSGFSETRLDAIAKDLGINIRDKNGNIFYDGLVSLLTALMGTNQGPRKNFGNDLSTLEDSFSVNQTDAAGQVGALGTLGGQYSDLFKGIVDLNDLPATRTRLRALFKDFQDGKISLRDMGGMSRSQFQSFLTMLIGRVDQAIGAAPAPAPDAGSTDVGGGNSNLVVGGGTSVTADTVQSVIKAMDNNLASILTSHTVIHERIAVATEGSYERLISIDGKMDTLIAVSGGTDRLDAALESERFALAVQQGRGVTFG